MLLNHAYCIVLLHVVQDIILLERVQCHSSKFILNDYSSDCKTYLAKLNLLPLMYIYELTDILFVIESLKIPNYSFDITKCDWICKNPQCMHKN